MDNLLFSMNPKKYSFKESIRNYIQSNQKEKINLTLSKRDIIKNRYESYNKYNNQNNFKFPKNSNKLITKSFNNNLIFEELYHNINTKKSYSIRLNQKNTNKLNIGKNSINIHNYNLSLKKKEKNKNNKTIDVNASSDKKDNILKKNNLFLYFSQNIKKDKEQNRYFNTLDNNYSKEAINSNNNNYINNIINININLDKKRKKYRNRLSLSLKNTINYVTENLINNLNHNEQKIKMNFYLKNKNQTNTSSLKSIKIKKDDEIGYNHTISNEIINNNKSRSKNTFLRLLSKNKKTNYISFGKLIKPTENKETKNFNDNNLKYIKSNILFKVKNSSKNNNHKILLVNDNINPIIKYNDKKPKKKKNYFIQKKDTDKVNKIKNYISLNNNNNKFIQSVNSPKEQEIKIFLKTARMFNDNYINYQPQLVKEYNQEILLNLLIDEYIFNKKTQLTLNSELFENYGIKPTIRCYLIDFLIGLQDTFKFHNKTLFITLQLFDSYISSIITLNEYNIILKEAKLDLIITACFLIASKSEESFIYHLSDYLSILSHKYTEKDLINMEYDILKFFNFEAFSPNILDFFEFFSIFFDLEKSLNEKGIIILIIVLSDLNLSQIPASFLSFSVICLLYNNCNYVEMINKLEGMIDNLYDKNNSNMNKNSVYGNFSKLLKPFKNVNEVKNIENNILLYIKNQKDEKLINILKKVKEYYNLK